MVLREEDLCDKAKSARARNSPAATGHLQQVQALNRSPVGGRAGSQHNVGGTEPSQGAVYPGHQRHRHRGEKETLFKEDPRRARSTWDRPDDMR